MNKENQYIISLGCGLNQLPLLRAIKAKGYHIIGIDQSPLAAGMELVDIRIYESITEYRRIYHHVKTLPIFGSIVACVTRSFGVAGKSAAYISEKLGLIGNAFADYDIFIDKAQMREKLLQANLPLPQGVVLAGAKRLPSLKTFPLPWLIKSRFSHGKKGNFFFSSKEEIVQFFQSGIKKKDWIVEQYLTQEAEYTLIGIVKNGQFQSVEIFQKITTGPPFFVELQHIAPAGLSLEQETLAWNLAAQAVQAMGIRIGPVIVEMIQHENDFYIIEIIPEFGGEYLAEALSWRVPNYNFFSEVLSLYLTPENESSLFHSLWQLIYSRINNFLTVEKESVIIQYIAVNEEEKQGVFKQLEWPAKNEWLCETRIMKHAGMEISIARNNHDRIAFFVMKGKDREKLKETVKDYLKNVIIKLN